MLTTRNTRKTKFGDQDETFRFIRQIQLLGDPSPFSCLFTGLPPIVLYDAEKNKSFHCFGPQPSSVEVNGSLPTDVNTCFCEWWLTLAKFVMVNSLLDTWLHHQKKFTIASATFSSKTKESVACGKSIASRFIKMLPSGPRCDTMKGSGIWPSLFFGIPGATATSLHARHRTGNQKTQFLSQRASTQVGKPQREFKEVEVSILMIRQDYCPSK